MRRKRVPQALKCFPSHRHLLSSPMNNQSPVNLPLVMLPIVLHTYAMGYINKRSPKQRLLALHRNVLHRHALPPQAIPTSRGERIYQPAPVQCNVKVAQVEILVAYWIGWEDMQGLPGINATRFRLESTTSLIIRQTLI